ncbi:Type 1 glutamine amidotransferase-like domain-containing protein [Paenibacillus sp. 481]|uniref:Type 1 glutamine amidotransferase-like domain-containing protein n=1 Tax=Paenibacillus sp. 481 TaxID=2835869 RepID=UPI001E2B60EC|nr:Type 1 glutamine amidotransferase-like domain-containing protein [Paenibacillus sp. 481]UHA72727.1 Type 1 glutamine amidotransferase-like domain-containing protein [Paenibacillus sp. 481]
MDTHLFLFGGGPPFTSHMARRFVEAAQTEGPVSILCVDRSGWEEYMPRYTQALRDLGVSKFYFLPLPTTPIEQVIACLDRSSGIIIGGGDTNLYADYIVETSISNTIKERYERGVPIAGFSAGALISPERCVISPHDNVEGVFQHRKGLGLIADVLIAVHFTEWNEEAHLRHAVSTFSDHLNYGIDEATCIYFRHGRLEATEGKGVYSIENEILTKISTSHA